MKKMLNVEAVRHFDVRGKELLYIKIEDLVINVGEKTFKEVQKLTGVKEEPEENPAQLKIDYEPITNIQFAEPIKKTK